MQQEHIESLEHMCRMYGVYEVAKAVKDYAKKTSREYKEAGNKDAVIHQDAGILEITCNAMAIAHPLRSKDVK